MYKEINYFEFERLVDSPRDGLCSPEELKKLYIKIKNLYGTIDKIFYSASYEKCLILVPSSDISSNEHVIRYHYYKCDQFEGFEELLKNKNII